MKSLLTNHQRLNLLSMYITDLELEVDRLRKQLQHLCHEGLELCRTRSTAEKMDPGDEGLQTLIEDIRDEATAPLDLDRIAPIDLRKLIEDVFRWQQRFESRAVARLVLSLTCERINWFPVRLRHILQNLIANAIRFCDPEKGENRISVFASVVGGSYEIRVSDNGMGMADAKLNHLLEPMYQTYGLSGAKPGVGIPIVKHLVEQSGGELGVDSGEGKGTCFVVILSMFEQGDFLE